MRLLFHPTRPGTMLSGRAGRAGRVADRLVPRLRRAADGASSAALGLPPPGMQPRLASGYPTPQ
jgi:hypothetical protein